MLENFCIVVGFYAPITGLMLRFILDFNGINLFLEESSYDLTIQKTYFRPHIIPSSLVKPSLVLMSLSRRPHGL